MSVTKTLGLLVVLSILAGCAGATTNIRQDNPALRPHVYPQPYQTVWDAAVKAAMGVKTWAITSTDRDSGVITISKGFNMWTTGTKMAVHVQELNDAETQVDMQSSLSGFNGILMADYGQNERNITRFFEELDGILATIEK